MPYSAISPRREKMAPMRADADARRMSQNSANTKPTPAAGPLIAAITGFGIDARCLYYGLFGETINVASRLQSMSAPNRVLVSDSTRKRLEAQFSLVPNGTIEIKGHGELRSWWLETARRA